MEKWTVMEILTLYQAQMMKGYSTSRQIHYLVTEAYNKMSDYNDKELWSINRLLGHSTRHPRRSRHISMFTTEEAALGTKED
jgi:hypothetical protein